MNRRWLPLLLFAATILLLGLVVPRGWQSLRLHQALAGLESEDADRVAEARQVLVGCGERAVGPLLALVGQPCEVRDEAAQVLREMDPAVVRAVVVRQVADPDPSLRMQVTKAVGWMEDPAFAAPTLPLLDDPEEEVRRAAVITLGFVRSEAALPRIRRLFVEGGEGLRGACARALGSFGRGEDRSLLERGRNDPSAYVRQEVERALADLPAPEVGGAAPDGS